MLLILLIVAAGLITLILKRESIMTQISDLGQTETTEPDPDALPALTDADRCDARCPAAARVRVRIQTTGHVLDFCKHHFEAHEDALRPECDAVLDEREVLA